MIIEEIEERLGKLNMVQTQVARFQGVHFAYAYKDGDVIQEIRKKIGESEWRYFYWILTSDGFKLIGGTVKSKFDQHVVNADIFNTRPI